MGLNHYVKWEPIYKLLGLDHWAVTIIKRIKLY